MRRNVSLAALLCLPLIACAHGESTDKGESSGMMPGSRGDTSPDLKAPYETRGAVASGGVGGAQLCCHGTPESNLMACLGPAKLVGSVDQANDCLADGANLLACPAEHGGWTCLPEKAGSPQVCSCGPLRHVGGTGVDEHTFEARAGATYQAHRADVRDAEPQPMCCDEIDQQAGRCAWTIAFPSALSQSGKNGGKGKPGGKGKEPVMNAKFPPTPAPPRGPMRPFEVEACLDSGGKVLSCPARATSCERQKTAVGEAGTTIQGACTCEAPQNADTASELTP